MTNRILSCPIPSNINPLSPNGFMFSVSKLPDLTFFCQEVNLPNITLGESAMATPLVMIPIAGDTLEFETLNVQFLIDSEMKNYTAIYNWMSGLAFPISYEQHKEFMSTSSDALDSTKFYSDAVLQILGNTNSTVKIVRFTDVFPVALNSLTFTSTSQDVQYLMGNATFRYTYYSFD